MNPAVQKTLSLLLLILIGVLLKKKINGKERLNGIKVMILSIALPATIFVALLKVKIDSSLLILPVFALAANFVLLLIVRYLYPLISGRSINDSTTRTMMLIIPSFAPGLSCFPFVTEYLGEETLAFAALADIGNKVFVLIILYLIAMQWYYQVQKGKLEQQQSKVKGLLLSLVQEPVNMVIVTAIILLCLGMNMESLPRFLQDGIGRMSLLMTPMVLIFIGLAVNINWRTFRSIAAILLFRSGCSFLISALLLSLFPVSSTSLILLAVIFPQSACSFWPFAHISSVAALEKKNNLANSTFDLDLALNILAVSLPFSTITILTICSLPSLFTHPLYILGYATIGILLGMIGLLRTNQNVLVKEGFL